MKHIIHTLIVLLLLVSCDKHREIPDDVLGDIFHDAILVNAYLNATPTFKIDSMNIYEPIFARYGYTTEDVQYTINHFSRRKSIRLGDVAEYMIARFEQESSVLKEQVARQDTINNVAQRFATRTVMKEEAIEVSSNADSSRLRFVLRDLEPGKYNVRGSYTLDSLDDEPNRRLYIYFEREDSTRQSLLNGSMQRRGKATINQEYILAENNQVRNLVIDFFYYGVLSPKKREAPHVTIHDLTITHTPTIEKSVEQLFEHQSQMRIFADTMLYLNHPKQ